MYGNPILVSQFLVSEVVPLIKNGYNDLLQIQYMNFLLDAFSTVLVIHYSKIDGSPNLIIQVILI